MGYPYGPESYPTIEMCEGKDVVDRISVVYGYECSKAEERKRQEAMARCNGDDCYVDTELTFAEQMKALGEAIGYVCDIDDSYDSHFITDLFNVLEDGVIGKYDKASIEDYDIKDTAASYARSKFDVTHPDSLRDFAEKLGGGDDDKANKEFDKLLGETLDCMQRHHDEYVERASAKLVAALTGIGVDGDRAKELTDDIVNETIDHIDVSSDLVAEECSWYVKKRSECVDSQVADSKDAGDSDDADTSDDTGAGTSATVDYAKQIASDVIDAADAAAAKVSDTIRNYVERRKGLSVEELVELQKDDLRRFKLLAETNAEEAKKAAFDRLHDAGIIDDDGKLAERYHDKLNAAYEKARGVGDAALGVAGNAVSSASDAIDRLRKNLNDDDGDGDSNDAASDGIEADERDAADAVDEAEKKIDNVDDIIG